MFGSVLPESGFRQGITCCEIQYFTASHYSQPKLLLNRYLSYVAFAEQHNSNRQSTHRISDSIDNSLENIVDWNRFAAVNSIGNDKDVDRWDDGESAPCKCICDNALRFSNNRSEFVMNHCTEYKCHGAYYHCGDHIESQCDGNGNRAESNRSEYDEYYRSDEVCLEVIFSGVVLPVSVDKA